MNDIRYDVTVTANYTINLYTVSFLDVGHTYSSQTNEYGSAINDPGHPSKSGYTFLGWYADSSYRTKIKFPITLQSNMKACARYIKNPSTPTAVKAISAGYDTVAQRYMVRFQVPQV
ncbi:InlB B-repeat-containing protein [Bacillus sp. ISL-46]|uniref:InlB B-repeat-containing protein n=1 Tax=Bacillus sp. ISL-46 TaxID=2819129 RepID=UPI0020353FC2|nr:InlB B-repeat-containing protein [Bacillus sp. ISL-46]